jgi:hypothetical protein
LEKVRPQVRQEQEKARHYLPVLLRFGLTLADRGEVDAKTGEADSPFDGI